jgi:hypothetical protein
LKFFDGWQWDYFIEWGSISLDIVEEEHVILLQSHQFLVVRRGEIVKEYDIM